MDNLDESLVKIIDFWQKNVTQGKLYSREIIKEIDLKSKEIIDLIGPRRSGKSSILKLIARKFNVKDYLYINFEDPFFVSHNSAEIIENLIEIYQEYFNLYPKYIFFDEIQEIKDWEKAIRKLRDEGKYKIFITGSSSKLLSREMSSLITGRHITYEVLPLSFKEFLTFRNMDIFNKKELILKRRELVKQFQQYCQDGGFPEIVITGNYALLKNYFYDILEKDIIRRYDIREKDVLEKLTLYLLSNSGNISSLESLKKTFSISFLPANSYLEYLKEAFLIYELVQFSYSLKKQEKAFKKYYSVDVGLSNAVSFKFSEDKGRILENLVLLELKRQGEELYYYRTKNNLEVDFAIKIKNKICQLVQVAWSLDDKQVENREIKALLEAMKEIKLDKAFILTYNEEKEITLDHKTIKVIPIDKWLIETEIKF